MSETDVRFEIGRVINQTFAVVGRHLGAFLVLSFILSGLPALFPFVAASVFGGPDLANAALNQSYVYFESFFLIIVQVLFASLLQGALTHAAISDLSGQPVTTGGSLAAGFRVFLPLLGIGLLVGLGVLFGLALFIVPGLLLLCRWAVASPVAVAERAGVFGAMARSAELTEGVRWRVFGLIAVYFVVVLIVGLVQQGVGQVIGAGSLAAALVDVVVATLTGLVSSTGIAVAYVELRRTREGAVPEAFASIFD